MDGWMDYFQLLQPHLRLSLELQLASMDASEYAACFIGATKSTIKEFSGWPVLVRVIPSGQRSVMAPTWLHPQPAQM
jgi:hypothetical protein